MNVLLVKFLGGLRPVDDAGAALLAKLGIGELVKVEIKRPRNVRFNAKFFAMLNIIFQNQDHYKSIDDLLAVCKLRTGHVIVIQTRDGEVRIPASISFSAMDDDEFAAFYDRAVAWVLAEVIPGLKRADLDEEVEQRLLAFAA